MAAPLWAQDGGRAPRRGPLHVPYVSQAEQLCGGAAAAMLMRYAGARGVHAAEFATLIDPSQGGIHTRDLATALRARGYAVAVSTGSASAAAERLIAGQPVMALIEDRPGRYHYVVLVGWTDGEVIFHDPARAPFLARRERDFDRAWAATDRWMLTIQAAPAVPPAAAFAPSRGARDPALQSFAEGRYRDAETAAAREVASDPANKDAWRLLAASRYLVGDERGALDAWNRAGDPRVDLVRLEGLVRTPHRVVERLIDIPSADPLTAERLARADRRLALLPSRQASRVSFTALPGNLAEVRGAVVERPMTPARADWLLEAARLPIDRELRAYFANLASAGDQLAASWRFREGQRRAAVEFAFPSSRAPGVWTLAVAWQREQYSAASDTEVRETRVGWTNWTAARLRLSAASGIARWAGRGTAALFDVGAEYRPLSRQVALDVSGSAAAAGGRAFATLGGSARAQWGTRPARLLGSATLVHATRAAPLDRWPGAGTGSARPLLLRAHPLFAGGAIDTGGAFGRTVAQATVETQRDVASRGPLSVGLAAFADVARAWNRLGGLDSRPQADVGVGLRVRLAPGQPAIRIDVARGVRDGATAVSFGLDAFGIRY